MYKNYKEDPSTLVQEDQFMMKVITHQQHTSYSACRRTVEEYRQQPWKGYRDSSCSLKMTPLIVLSVCSYFCSIFVL